MTEQPSELMLPVNSFRDAATFLRRPFSPEAIRWKFQTTWPKAAKGQPAAEPTGGMIVAYIDRGLVIDRLNLVLPALWEDDYEDLGSGLMRCRLTVDGITREDVGEGGTLKARYSDSLKRAAVKFGIGVSLTRIPKSRLAASDGTCTGWARGERSGLDLTQAGLDYLRDRYRGWLEAQGVSAFGQPFEHGDAGDAQGDDEEGGSPVAESTRTDVLLGLLSGGDFTLREQRALLVASGVGGLPDALQPETVARAVRGLTDDQANDLHALISQKRERQQEKLEGVDA